ncbi:kinase binding protein CGI-121-domain-containing protein [Bombardia bombarda]|uniref:EKC/KEOPS complex subunit CGI121 n=1 Tax=Bombardia bombarda TaxID=252184 RepID=A0AA40C4A3_9PEZI|nr:kinase binding protein CGI-121-domain-containing protein [Bombardia bombarda]
MQLETVRIQLTEADTHIALFRDVANVGALYGRLIAKNPEFEYAFIDASTIVSPLHLLSAIFRAYICYATGKLQTNNIHSEIVLSLSPNNNINESYRRWGPTPGKTKDMIVVKVVPDNVSEPRPTADGIRAHLAQHIDGRSVPFSDEEIRKSTDRSKVTKYYKLKCPTLDNLKDPAQREREEERLVIMGMALREL